MISFFAESSPMSDLQIFGETMEKQPIDDISIRICIGYNYIMKYNFERKRFPVTEWNYTFLYREDIYDESGRLLWSSSRFIDDFFPSDYYFINPDKGDSLFKNFSTRRFDLSEIGEFTSGHICFTLAYYNKDTGSVLCGASGMYGAYGLSAMGGFTFNKDKDGAVAFSKKLVSYGHGSTCNDSERELEEATRSGHK